MRRVAGLGGPVVQTHTSTGTLDVDTPSETGPGSDIITAPRTVKTAGAATPVNGPSLLSQAVSRASTGALHVVVRHSGRNRRRWEAR